MKYYLDKNRNQVSKEHAYWLVIVDKESGKTVKEAWIKLDKKQEVTPKEKAKT